MTISAQPDRSPASGPTQQGGSISPQNSLYLREHIYKAAGIVLDADKHYLFESRLMPILREEKVESLDALCHYLRLGRHPILSRQVVDAMTTNETLFFRDAPTFDVLRTQIIPGLLERRGDRRKLRIWSAAASSGQEAYSLAMMLLEMKLHENEVEIIGTDISEKMLERARSGQYVQFEMNRGLPTPYLIKYFAANGSEWKVRDEVRTMVRFELFDLRANLAKLGMFDLVLCRNVLIYFDQETKNAIIDSINKVLYPQGVLLLGCAESMNTLRGNYSRHQVGHTTFYRAETG